MDTKIRQRRAQVLQEMDQIQTMERGKLCEMRRGGAGSEERVYFNHQYWQSGRNHSRYVAGAEAGALREAIEGRQRFAQLAEEFVELTVSATRAQAASPEGKKNARKKSGRRSLPKPLPS
jgi:hypothetical protein